MLLEIPFWAKKNAQIMLNSQNNATLVPENALFYFIISMGKVLAFELPSLLNASIMVWSFNFDFSTFLSVLMLL